MDSNELERERGITILAKNTAVDYGRRARSTSSTRRATPTSAARSSARWPWSTASCCWSTPPRARCRRPASCCRRRSRPGSPPIVCINKIDRADARVAEVLDEVYGLFIDLDATEEQLDFPVVYTNARAGTADARPRRARRRPPPALRAASCGRCPARSSSPTRRRSSSPTTSTTTTTSGRLAIGRVKHGSARAPAGSTRSAAPTARSSRCKLHAALRLARPQAHRDRRAPPPATSSPSPASRTSTSATPIADRERPSALPPIRIDEPTIAMIFGANTSPVGGPRGRATSPRASCASGSSRSSGATSACAVEDTDVTRRVPRHRPRRAAARHPHRDHAPRGLRAAGVEADGRHARGRRRDRTSRSSCCSSTSRRTTSASSRSSSACARGKMTQDDPRRHRPRAPRVRRAVARPDRLPLALPHRDARHRHHQRALQRLGAVARRHPVAHQRRHGRRPRGRRDAVRHLPHAGARHPVRPAGHAASTRAWSSASTRATCDLDVNICREKKLTNIRAAGRDENVLITPHRDMGLEAGIEWIDDDELVEVTPDTVRLRKRELRGAFRPRGPRSARANEPPAAKAP